MKKEKENRNMDSNLQPILFTKEQYKDLLRAIGVYALIKQSADMPQMDPTGLGDYLMEKGTKFGFEEVKMDEADWFDEMNEEVFEALFEYTQEQMWRHLAYMLANRDISKEIEDKTGLSEDELPAGTFSGAIATRVEMYLDEFEKHGLDNVSVACKDGHAPKFSIKRKM